MLSTQPVFCLDGYEDQHLHVEEAQVCPYACHPGLYATTLVLLAAVAAVALKATLTASRTTTAGAPTTSIVPLPRSCCLSHCDCRQLLASLRPG